jgi:hypothetical protein
VPFAAQFVEVIWSEGTRQGAGKSIDRILLADQDQLTWAAGLGPEAIAHFEPSPNEGVLGDRDLILGAHPGVSATSIGLYSCTHR